MDTTQEAALLSGLLTEFAGRVSRWAHHDYQAPTLPIQPDLVASSGLLLGILDHAVADDDMAAFRSALNDGGSSALSVLQQLVNDCREVAEPLSNLAVKWFSKGKFQQVREQGPIFALIALSADQFDSAAMSAFVTARSFWAALDAGQTVDNYQLAIAAAERSNADTRVLRSASHDNMGIALSRLDRLDEAVGHFDAAAALELDVLDQLQIRSNKADAYKDFGEYETAAWEHRQVVAGLEAHGADPLRLAMGLDNWAAAAFLAGDVEQALALNERAATLIPAEAVDDRWKNDTSRMNTYLELARYDDAAAMFRAAWDAAVEHAKDIDVAQFRQGYQVALGRLLPKDSPAWGLLFAATEAQRTGRWAEAKEHYVQLSNVAAQAGDELTYLKCRANVAAVLSEQYELDEAWAECREVLRRARAAGLAYPIAQCEITSAAVLGRGSDQSFNNQALECSAKGIAYAGVHDTIFREFDLPVDHIEQLTSIDLGVVQSQLADYARDAHAYDIAESSTRDSIAAAIESDNPVREMRRKARLLAILNEMPGRTVEADALAAELIEKAATYSIPPRDYIALLAQMGVRAGNDDGLAQLREAARLLEQLRATTAPGPARGDIDERYGVYGTLLHVLQRTGAPNEDAFAALQAMRARRLMELVTARSGATEPYRPPDVDEVVSLLSRLSRLTTFVDVTVTKDGLRAYLVDRNGLRAVDVPGDTEPLRRIRFGDVTKRAVEAVALVRNSALLRDAARAFTDALEPQSTILLAVDDALANLPLHAVPLGDSAWGDVVSIGRIPAIGALRFTPPGRTWSGRSIVAGNSNGDLPGAAQECGAIGDVLGVAPLIGDECTFDAVRSALDQSPTTRIDLVHLAVHGRADPRRGGRSSLLFAGQPPVWMPFAELAALPWDANLITFSGCSTAVGGPRNGAGLYGVAQAAAEAGATTVIASLWPVDDADAAIFMTALYRELGARCGQGWVDLREMMDLARAHLRKTMVPAAGLRTTRGARNLLPLGDRPADDEVIDPTLAAMIQWAPFVVIGEPMMPV